MSEGNPDEPEEWTPFGEGRFFLHRTISPYEQLKERERNYLLDLAREIASALEPSFTPPTARFSETREQTPYLLTVTTRYGDAGHGLEMSEYWQDSHGLPKEAGRSLKVSPYGHGGRASIAIDSRHWPGTSDAGFGVTLSVTAPEEELRAVVRVIEQMEENRRQCTDGGRMVGTNGVLPDDPREFARRGNKIACNRLRCALCGSFVRHRDDHELDGRSGVLRALTRAAMERHSIGVRAAPGARLYECACAVAVVREFSKPLRGDCDTGYDATWWCAGHPSKLDELATLDRALPRPWNAARYG
jgi:hypothetical protein